MGIALLRARLEQRERGIFARARDILLEIRDSYKNRPAEHEQPTERDIVRRYTDAPVLVLDELRTDAERSSSAVSCKTS
jgi:DNA replication protein DnaC